MSIHLVAYASGYSRKRATSSLMSWKAMNFDPTVPKIHPKAGLEVEPGSHVVSRTCNANEIPVQAAVHTGHIPQNCIMETASACCTYRWQIR